MENKDILLSRHIIQIKAQRDHFYKQLPAALILEKRITDNPDIPDWERDLIVDLIESIFTHNTRHDINKANALLAYLKESGGVYPEDDNTLDMENHRLLEADDWISLRMAEGWE